MIPSTDDLLMSGDYTTIIEDNSGKGWTRWDIIVRNRVTGNACGVTFHREGRETPPVQNMLDHALAPLHEQWRHHWVGEKGEVLYE